jgi:serine phosphatase RsbU (regulator of sigma subunit)
MTDANTAILSILYLVCGVVLFLLGLTLLRIGRSSPPTRAAALMLFFAGLGPLLSGSGVVLEQSLREGAVLYTSMVQNFEYLWEFYFPSLLLFALCFPRENRALSRYPVIGFVVFLPYVFHLAAMVFGDRMLEKLGTLSQVFPAEGDLRGALRDIEWSSFDAVVGIAVRILEHVHRNLFAVVNVVYAVVALYLLRRSHKGLLNPRLARQLRTVGLGVAVSVACYAFAKASLLTNFALAPRRVSLALLNLSLVASGATIAYAVTRQQFLGVRNILQRAALYGAVAVVFALVYWVVVRPVTLFFGQYSATSQEVFETGFIVLVVLAFQPALERAEVLLEGTLMRGRGGLARRFKSLGDAVAAATTLEALDDTVTKGLKDALDASEVRLAIAQSPDDPVVVALADIGEPVRRRDLMRVTEPKTRRWRRGKQKAAHVMPEAPHHPSVAAEHLPPRVDVFVPVVTDKRCVAYVALGEKVYGLSYGAEELGHLSFLSTQIGSALQSIRLLAESVDRKVFEEELKIARKIQMQMLPGDPPALDGFDLFAVTVPSRQVGGDYYDFVVIDQRWLVVVVADVSGKGIPASILTATLQATVRSNADAQTQPAGMMGRLNRLLYRNTSDAEFATAFYVLVDLQNGSARYANAGHDFPFVLGNGGSHALVESGLVLGCIDNFAYDENHFEIPEHGALVMFTDGVTDAESRSGEAYGTERLRAVLERHAQEPARDLCRRIIEDVRTFGDGENQDDLTLVVLKRGARAPVAAG